MEWKDVEIVEGDQVIVEPGKYEILSIDQALVDADDSGYSMTGTYQLLGTPTKAEVVAIVWVGTTIYNVKLPNGDIVATHAGNLILQ